MQITVLAVGKKMPDWVNTATNEYKKRLSPELGFKLVEIQPARRTKNSTIKNILETEAERIKSAIVKNSHVIVLDEKGKTHTTAEFSDRIRSWMNESMDTTFIIGGADGLDSSVKSMADETWCMSSYTMPHGMVRILLVEQVYRAWSILTGHPYHRE